MDIVNVNGAEIKVENVNSCLYRAFLSDCVVFFSAEYKNGTYSKIKSVTKGGKTYSAQRYHYQYIPVVRDIAFALLKADKLWDYARQQPALISYNADLARAIKR